MVTARALILPTCFAALFVACAADETPTPASSATPPSIDGGEGADASDASAVPAPLLPYPPGPYSAEIGGVVRDFRVQGYALSPEERDSRKLPFRDITLAEVRSKPGC